VDSTGLAVVLLGTFLTLCCYVRAQDDVMQLAEVELGSLPSVCHARGTVVLVTTSKHTLALCDRGELRAMFRVALGAGGIGKATQGDRKTPLGRYSLARPRRSKDFHRFIPIGYPTPAQVRAGFRGNGIGLHGPSRSAARWSPLERVSDWTDGCVAVWTDSEIEEIVLWVSRNLPVDLVIE